MKIERLLTVLLKLRADTEAADQAIVDALRDLRWFTGILLIVPAWQERPDAPEHPLVKLALQICRDRGIEVTWCRRLWWAWETCQPLKVAESYFEPAHYVAAIVNLNNEFNEIGAEYGGLDLEPYGSSPDKPILKGRLTDEELAWLDQAVTAAVHQVGKVDIVWPTSSSDSRSYKWRLRHLGECWADAMTYGVTAPEYKIRKANPPDGQPYRVDYWGSAVGEGWLTPQQIMALDREEIGRLFPESDGRQWVWGDHDALPDLMREFGRQHMAPRSE